MLRRIFAVLVLVFIFIFIFVPISRSLGFGQSLADDPRVASGLELLETWLEAQRAYEDIPGLSMALVYDQEVLWKGAFGYADRAREVKATTRTIYSICSISKLFTSLGVMQLRDAGMLDLDDPVREHLPWFNIEQAYPGSAAITIRGLVTHSAGLPRESDYPYWTGPGFDFPTREMVVDRISDQETLYPAARYFQYSNLGLTLAGEIVAARSSGDYAAYVEEKILAPLGLDDTSTEIPMAERGKRFAAGYGARKRQGERPELSFFQTRGIAPAAGYASTVEDLAEFASWQFRLLETGGYEILNANTLREMHRVHWVDPDWETHWGLGFATWRDGDKTFVGHGGGCPGFRSHFMLHTDDKIGAIVMTNAIDIDSNKYTRAAHQIVTPAVAEALDSPGAGRAPDPSLRMYAGTYDFAWGGELAVLPWEDGLAALSLPTDEPLDALTKLEKTGDHTFRRVRSDGTLGETFVFELSADGQVARFKRHSNYYTRIR